MTRTPYRWCGDAFDSLRETRQAIEAALSDYVNDDQRWIVRRGGEVVAEVRVTVQLVKRPPR